MWSRRIECGWSELYYLLVAIIVIAVSSRCSAQEYYYLRPVRSFGFHYYQPPVQTRVAKPRTLAVGQKDLDGAVIVSIGAQPQRVVAPQAVYRRPTYRQKIPSYWPVTNAAQYCVGNT